MLGPVDFIMLGFRGNSFDGSIMRELNEVVDKGIVRVLDLVFIMKDANGTLIEGEYEDQSPELQKELGDLAVADDTPLLTEDDIAKIGELMEPETAAGVLVIEHLWAKNLKQAIANADGFVVADGRIHPEDAMAAMEELEHTTAAKE